MPTTKYEFTTDKLSYGAITRHYGLGCADSSDFMEIEEGISSEHYIMANRGIIKFSISAYKMTDGNYNVTVCPSSVRIEM